MNKLTTAMKLSLCALALGTSVAAFGQPVITSFSGNGVLVCSNLAAGSVAMVEWASSLSGPWNTNWAGLDAVTVDCKGMMQVSVPMFYRVRGTNSVPPGSVPSGMAPIPAGCFTMGDAFGEGRTNELPVHQVSVSVFYMDTNLVSYTLWQQVYQWATTHGYSFDYINYHYTPANQPAIWVDWYDCVKWCNARSEMGGLTPCYYTDATLATVYRSDDLDLGTNWVNWGANGYRLPTEAEWEKAARGGASGHRFPWSDADTINWSRANYVADPTDYSYDVNPTSGGNPAFTSEYNTSPVGSFAPNWYGLYDMAGNVWQWCWDWRDDAYYSSSPSTNPCGPASSGIRVSRGGAWTQPAFYARCAYRGGNMPAISFSDIGFRCVRAF